MEKRTTKLGLVRAANDSPLRIVGLRLKNRERIFLLILVNHRFEAKRTSEQRRQQNERRRGRSKNLSRTAVATGSGAGGAVFVISIKEDQNI